MTFQPIKKASITLLLSCIALFFATASFAQTTTTYTAVTNGNYTNASTWQNGIKPPPVLGDTSGLVEKVLIPQGITVTLDTNLFFATDLKPGIARGELTVHGTLNALPGYYMAAHSYMYGNASGVINVDSTDLSSGSFSSGFKGTLTTEHCNLDNHIISGTLNINKALYLPKYSNTNMVAGALNYGNHCWIYSVAKPQIEVVGSGVINYADTMNLSYEELWLGGLHMNIDTGYVSTHVDSFIIDLFKQYAPNTVQNGLVIAHKDLNFNGVMIIKSGILILNKHKVTFGPYAKLYCTPGKGGIAADKDAEIVVNAISDFGNGFYFWDMINTTVQKYKMDTIKSFTVNMGSNSGKVTLLNSLTIANTLDLKKGQLYLDSSQLKIQSGSSATITNAGPNSYITSNYRGELHRDVAASGTTTFPVGTPAHYAPIDVKNNSGSMEVYKVGARGGVLDTATTGFDIATQEPCVGATWWVNPSLTTGSNADITIKWPTAMEVNSFDRTQSFISHYDHNAQKWDTQPSPSAATQSGNFYTHTETVNNFNTILGNGNYFAVFDNHTSLANLSVNSLTANNKITLYPNPTTGNATIDMKLDQTQTIAVTLTDVSGRIVYNKAAMQYSTGNHAITLPTQTLNSGLYFVQLTNERGTVLNSGKLMKQ